jgi:hypothetical protein
VKYEMELADSSKDSRLTSSRIRAGLNMTRIETCFHHQPQLVAPRGTIPCQAEED